MIIERLSSRRCRFAIKALEKDREREAMPKKMGVNSKAEATRAWKSVTESEWKERDARVRRRKCIGAKPRELSRETPRSMRRRRRNAPRLANWLRWRRRRSKRLTKN
ncbi:hypothetical protein FCV25MIE_01559 [Fagus crenata]